VRRLAFLGSLLAAVAVTGTASGSLDRTPRDVIEQALTKVRPAPDYSGSTTGAGNRVRVIVTLDDPPLAAATFARRLPGFGTDPKLNLSTRFSQSYLGRLEAAQTSRGDFRADEYVLCGGSWSPGLARRLRTARRRRPRP